MKDDPHQHPTQEPPLLQQAPRYGAKTRSGRPCRSPAVAGRRPLPDARWRVRIRGPKGGRNGNYKHGRYTAEANSERDFHDENRGNETHG
jgi:hypothetical protein